MPIPKTITHFNKKYLNRLTVHLAGRGNFIELEHAGRHSGRTFHTPLMAFRNGGVVTIALTYGSDVDWLKNVRAAGGARMHIGKALVSLGAPVSIPRDDGLGRMPLGPRLVLPIIGGDHFIELPILEERVFVGWGA